MWWELQCDKASILSLISFNKLLEVTNYNSKRKHKIPTGPVLCLANFMLYILRSTLEWIRGKVSVLDDFSELAVIKRKVVMVFLNIISLTLWMVLNSFWMQLSGTGTIPPQHAPSATPGTFMQKGDTQGSPPTLLSEPWEPGEALTPCLVKWCHKGLPSQTTPCRYCPLRLWGSMKNVHAHWFCEEAQVTRRDHRLGFHDNSNCHREQWGRFQTIPVSPGAWDFPGSFAWGPPIPPFLRVWPT